MKIAFSILIIEDTRQVKIHIEGKLVDPDRCSDIGEVITSLGIIHTEGIVAEILHRHHTDKKIEASLRTGIMSLGEIMDPHLYNTIKNDPLMKKSTETLLINSITGHRLDILAYCQISNLLTNLICISFI